MLAFPVETIPAADDPWARIVALAEEYGAVAVVVGLPRTLAGEEGLAAGDIRARAAALAAAVAPVPVGLVDERMTTAVATKRLRSAGRTARTQRVVVDQVAATVILEGVLEADRRGGSTWQRVVPLAEEETT